MVLDLFAMVVMLILLAAIIFLAAWIGGMPGKVARSRSHPQADAINACGWIGLITLGAPWIVAMVWAFTRPVSGSHAELAERIARLESELERLRAAGGGS